MFSFERTEELERLVEAYFSLNASVNPIKYDEAMKTLRTLAMGPKSRHENTLPSFVAAYSGEQREVRCSPIFL